MCSPELGKKSKKKEKKKKEPILEHHISPLCPTDPTGPICTILARRVTPPTL